MPVPEPKKSAPHPGPGGHSVADIVNPDKVRAHRSRVQPQADDITVALSEVLADSQIRNPPLPDPNLPIPREQQLLLAFRGNNHKGIRNGVIQRLRDDSHCSDALILRRCPGDQFRVFSTNEALDNVSYSTRAFPGITEVLTKRIPVVLDKNFDQVKDQWRTLFYYKPKILILIPVNIYRVRPKRELVIECITVLAYNGLTLPKQLMDEDVLTKIYAFCNWTAPLLFNVQRFDDIQTEFTSLAGIFESFRNVMKEIHDVSSCINTIGVECLTLFQASYAVLFLVVNESYDARLLKYCSFGGGKVQEGCPARESHLKEELVQQTKYPAGWAALHKKCIRANDVNELAAYCGANAVVHSIGGCVVRNIMCFVIEDYSNDMSLVIELSDKGGGFTDEDEARAATFSKVVGAHLSSAVMLDYRNRAVRRHDITNKVINNIKQVAVKKVRHLLDLQFNYSSSFRRKFFNYRFIVRRLQGDQLPNILLYMFTELKFISRWKMRRATLIRFILSIKQGYRNNPYHNWKHACNSAHFAFILLLQADLQKKKFLTDLEALALYVSCICHDIDHRGVNSRLISTFTNHNEQLNDKPSFYSLYNQEEGLVQRQHLTVALNILSSDDCNIVENLSDEEYREFIQLVQLCITATSLEYYMTNREEMFKSLKNFDKKNSTHRKHLLAVLMTVCDLSETVKTWDEYILTVKSIFSEFFAQGDEELYHGVTPNPTMDRRSAYIPLIEVKFINDVVRPAYEVVTKILPKIEECIHKIDYFKELWIVSTKVFQDFANKKNPLEILEKVEMREDHLKTLTHPDLQRRAQRYRQSVVRSTTPSTKSSRLSLPMLSSATFLSSSKSMDFNSISLHATSLHALDLDFEDELGGRSFKKERCPCCCCCRKGGDGLGLSGDGGGRCGGACCTRGNTGRCYCGRGGGSSSTSGRSPFSKCFLIFRCKHDALEDASVVRRCDQEDAFMVEQSYLYIRNRSKDSEASHGDSRVSFKSIIVQ